MDQIHETVAEKIAESLGMRTIAFCSTPGHCDSTIQGHIEAILDAQYGRSIQAAHLFLDDHFLGCTLQDDPNLYEANLAKQLNRFHSNGDGTGTITPRNTGRTTNTGESQKG